MTDIGIYETSDPITIGGATGQYYAPSPYHTECEWAIISVTGIGTLASPATYAIGSKNPKQPTLSTTGTDSFGSVLTSGPDSNNGLQAFVGAATSAAPMITYGGGADGFMPMPSPSFVYLTVATPATTELLVTIQFRRLKDMPLPDKPRAKPHTHSHVTGRRDYRTMMEGFSNQYPGEGIPYEHRQLQPQDTEMGKRGVSPLQQVTQLGPTNVTHRGVAKNRGR